MRIGTCHARPEFFKTLAALGYDYLEGNFSAIAGMSDEAFEIHKAALLESGLKYEVCNGFFPGNFVLYAYDHETGEATADFSEVEKNVLAYVQKNYARVAQLGTEVVVIGSGAARKVPDDMKLETAIAQFGRVLEICADEAKKYGIVVTVEPLNTEETNSVNTLADSLDIIDRLQHPNIKAMNDFFHSMKQNEPLASLERAGDRLVHLHIARPTDRRNPTLIDEPTFTEALQTLKKIGYNSRMSLESVCPVADAGIESYPLLRKIRNMFAE